MVFIILNQRFVCVTEVFTTLRAVIIYSFYLLSVWTFKLNIVFHLSNQKYCVDQQTSYDITSLLHHQLMTLSVCYIISLWHYQFVTSSAYDIISLWHHQLMTSSVYDTISVRRYSCMTSSINDTIMINLRHFTLTTTAFCVTPQISPFIAIFMNPLRPHDIDHEFLISQYSSPFSDVP